MKIVGVYGFKKSGKTTVVTSIINSLVNKGYKVSSAKSIHIDDFSLETDGTDTFKHNAAGAERVGLVYPKGKAILYYDLDISEFLNKFESDYLILEGFRELKCPKILCARNESDLKKDFRDEVICISGLVSREISSYEGIPVISYKDIDKITEIIEKL
ncbi:MAG: molybdopterin-guanine dinucleotide biosynthesis protein B [Candidatus Methanofastidiosum methylothiophilum]|uniref:Molybdopterin-guanine dinucleotide biosynthesis protein B n=1 Tax=Candidatus Methanofastidiosum methylothiophilum TaxID=1705564 RepID=A0A150JA37_9EURY|nr:MAG: molybdopterin-guanine dinucleotide biosynthesis protein B [Candidatus Methanofastidiosum methylthiophilus]